MGGGLIIGGKPPEPSEKKGSLIVRPGQPESFSKGVVDVSGNAAIGRSLNRSIQDDEKGAERSRRVREVSETTADERAEARARAVHDVSMDASNKRAAAVSAPTEERARAVREVSEGAAKSRARDIEARAQKAEDSILGSERVATGIENAKLLRQDVLDDKAPSSKDSRATRDREKLLEERTQRRDVRDQRQTRVEDAKLARAKVAEQAEAVRLKAEEDETKRRLQEAWAAEQAVVAKDRKERRLDQSPVEAGRERMNQMMGSAREWLSTGVTGKIGELGKKAGGLLRDAFLGIVGFHLKQKADPAYNKASFEKAGKVSLKIGAALTAPLWAPPAAAVYGLGWASVRSAKNVARWSRSGWNAGGEAFSSVGARIHKALDARALARAEQKKRELEAAQAEALAMNLLKEEEERLRLEEETKKKAEAVEKARLAAEAALLKKEKWEAKKKAIWNSARATKDKYVTGVSSAVTKFWGKTLGRTAANHSKEIQEIKKQNVELANAILSMTEIQKQLVVALTALTERSAAPKSEKVIVKDEDKKEEPLSPVLEQALNDLKSPETPNLDRALEDTKAKESSDLLEDVLGATEDSRAAEDQRQKDLKARRAAEAKGEGASTEK